MADKIEYSRMLVKRTDQTGEVPTVPPITAVTLNQFIPTDLFVGEFFLNEVDDLLWVRTLNGILPISLSGSTGTTVPNLTQVLFQGNATNGYDIEVSAGDTIIFSGLTSGVTSQFLGIDASGNTIVSSVTPGTPNLSSVLTVGNTTNGFDIEVSSGDTIVFDGLTTGSTTNILGLDASGNTIVTSVSSTNGLYLPLSGGTVTGNTYFGTTSGITMDQVNNRIGINTATPQHTIDAFGTKSRLTYENTAGGVLQISGDTFLPRINAVGAPNITKPLFALSMGVRTWDDITYPGYGKVGDGFLYASNEMNGLNILNRQGTGTTEDYIRFYAGQDANGTTPDIHIQGSGATRGYVGIGTINPTEMLDIAGNTIVGGNLTIGSIGGTTPVINLGVDANGLVVSGGTSGSGTSGTSGSSGANGTSGTSGVSGSAGSNGTSGSSGQSGTSGTSGVSGSSGSNGTSGSSGINGLNGDPLTVYDSTSGVTNTNVTGMTFVGASVISSGDNVTITVTGSTDNFVPYNIAIPLNTTGNVTRYISPVDFELSDIKANVYPAPGSENLEILIQKNGTTIFSSGSVVINSGQTTNQSQDPYILSATTFNEWDSITISASTFSGATILYLNGCQEESCSAVPPSPTPTPTPTPTPSPSGDTDATAYLAAVVATGGTVNGTITTAVNTLFTSLKSAGLYSKIDLLMPMIGSTKPSMIINAKAPTNTSWLWTEFGTALTYNATGIKGNGNGALRSNFTQSALSTTTSGGHFSLYCNSLPTYNSALNGFLQTSPLLSTLGAGTFTNWYGGINAENTFNGTTSFPTKGLWLMNRTGTTYQNFLVNDTSLFVRTTTPLSAPNINIALFTLYWPGQGFANDLYAGDMGDPKYCTLTIGQTLTTQEQTDLNTIITTFNTSLSRN